MNLVVALGYLVGIVSPEPERQVQTCISLSLSGQPLVRVWLMDH